MNDIKIAFWNVQNLFDTSVSQLATDFDYTPENFWTEETYHKKISNLASIINILYNGKGPDLLGVCEVENIKVVQDLVSHLNRRDYRIAHIDSPDIRGIDTCLIYSNVVFELLNEPIGHVAHLRYATRDIFQVDLKVRENQSTLTILVNHWPSRKNGLYESEPYRISVASYCGEIIDSLLKFSKNDYLKMSDSRETLEKLSSRWNTNILLMGDFNDEPYNRSIMDELKASSGIDGLEENLKKSRGRETPTIDSYLDKQAFLFNCMWPLLGQPDTGTHYFAGSTNTMNLLDQFMISRGLYFGYHGLLFDVESVKIATPSKMKTKAKARPIPFDKRTAKGYSDHFPITGLIKTL